MKTAFETELSQALATRAAGLPPGAAARLRAADYHPREHRLRAPTVGVGVLAGAATAGTVLAVVLGGSAPAYAGWSATPTSDTPSSSADATCQSQLASMSGAPGGSATSSGDWQNVLTDVRGPFTVELFQDGGSYAACFTGSSFTSVNQISSNGASGESSNALHVSGGSAAGGGGPLSAGTSAVGRISTTSSAELQQVVESHLTTASDGPYTLIDGRTEPGVTAVTLILDDGQDVVATVDDGWFVAWWPGSGNVTSAQVTTAAGTATQPLELQSVPAPLPGGGPGSGSIGTHSNSGSSGSSGSSGDSGNSGPSVNSSSSGNSGNS
jgi:hypothetical protein